MENQEKIEDDKVWAYCENCNDEYRVDTNEMECPICGGKVKEYN